MADNDKIEYKDLVNPDDSITRLISQLEQLNTTYGKMLDSVKSNAKSVVNTVKTATGATNAVKVQIEHVIDYAERLKRFEDELKFALSDTGKQVAWLKAQIKDVNKVSVDQERMLNSLSGSYNRLKSELSSQIAIWKSLSDSQRMDVEVGGQVLSSIISLKKELLGLDAQLKPAITKLTELEKAEQRLAFLQSEEGQKLIEVKKQISEVIGTRKAEKQEVSELEKAQQKLQYLRSEEGQKLIEVKKQINETVNARKAEKAEVDESVRNADRLKKAESELNFALSETGKQVAWLKAQTSDANKASVEQARQAEALSGSYDKIKSELNENIKLWRALSDAEREDAAMGGQVLETIIALKDQLSQIDAQLKPAIAKLSDIQKAEQKLAFLQSEEGQRLLELRRQIKEVSSGRKEEVEQIDAVAAAYERLQYAKSNENIRIKEYNIEAAKQNKIAKLLAQLNIAKEGSYEKLAAQYALNKIKLNEMSTAERNAAEIGGELEKQTLRLYKQMIHLQEATGNYKLSVGNYAKTWDGLGNAVNQIVREIPAATIGINTFFLAISNNVPILIDEIERVKQKNEMLRAEGRPTRNIIQAIVSSILSWQTALILVITALSMHGKAIFKWIGDLGKAHNATMTMMEIVKAMNEELKNTNGSYGENIVKLKQLQDEWKKLTSDDSRIKWIKDNDSAFKSLNIAIKSVNDAEDIFEKNTENVKNAFKARAKAAAAMKLAAEKYEEALLIEQEAKTRQMAGPDLEEAKAVLGVYASPAAAVATTREQVQETATKRMNDEIKKLNEKSEAVYKDADAFFDLGKSYESAADGLSKYIKAQKDEPKGRQPRDLTDTIYRNGLQIQKKYEESITKLQRDEYIKRRKEAVDSTLDANRQLEERYRKNEEYVKNVNGKYKELTAEQKKQIAQQQAWILDTIANNLEQLNFEIEQIEKERKINSLKILRETIDWELEEIAKSVENEKAIKLEQLKQEEDLIKKTNATVKEGARDESEITAEYEKKRQQIIAQYDKTILDMRNKDMQNQIELTKKGSQEELRLLLQQNEIARQLALAENRAKPAALQQSEAQINDIYDKKGLDITGSFTMTGFDEAQAEAEAVFNIVERSERDITRFKLQQERERWQKQLELAKAGALKWSDAQIAEAEATIKGLDRQIKKIDNAFDLIADKGLGGALLYKLGFDDDSISALSEAANIVIENIQAIMQAEVDLANIQVEKAKERTEAALSAYEAEIEARNNGYANSVATAKKELQQERKNQAQKERLLEEAQRRQEKIDTAIQASSLITASANLWSVFSKAGFLGPALAIAAIAAMWSSFAMAKIKAAQVTREQSQEYGEGGLEFLEGGSHASGNDIDLATKNSKGKNMRAEGGEALAIINKKNTRKYRKQLPDIVNSLNKGIFEEKYLRAFEKGETLQAQIVANSTIVDLSRVEKGIEDIRKQGETKYYIADNGRMLEVHRNVKRYYR